MAAPPIDYLDSAASMAPTQPTLPPAAAPQPQVFGLNLFWRTFFLLAVLLVGSILAWLQTLRALEYEPRTLHTAQQIASLVNLTRAALTHADAIARVALVKTMADQEGVRIVPREPADRWEPIEQSALGQRLASELIDRLGPGTVIARSVNGEQGLWVGFTIDEDANWLLLDRSRFSTAGGVTWLIWLVTAAGLSLAGAAAIARLVNRPLKQISAAANKVREGDFANSRLDENAVTAEIREVNLGFNRMARRLAEMEQDRAVMLAGISHDLRTPLARLRLETEMSVEDPDARAHMVADMEQLDAIIDKFLDYARPDHVEDLRATGLSDVVASCTYAVQDSEEFRLNVHIPEALQVMADSTELARVVSNLIENARRYGKSPGGDVVDLDIAAVPIDGEVLLTVRDHGRGVPAQQLPELTKPFFRGDTARTSATGAGLGLSIVEKTVRRMGGTFTLGNAPSGGLIARIQLKRAPDKAADGAARRSSRLAAVA